MITSWKDISVELYREINDLDISDLDDYHLNLISILADVSIDYLEDLDINEFEDLMEKARFIMTKPLVKAKHILNISNDIILHKINLSNLTVGEFIDLENLVSKDFNKNFSIILSILYRVKIREATLLHKDEIEPYGNYIFHRAQLFDSISLIDVYGAVSDYINYRTMLFKSYAGLFNNDDDLDDDDVIEVQDGQENNMQKRERLKKEAIDSSVKKWGWDSMLVKLAGNDILKIDAVTKLPIIQAFNILSIKKELNLE